jgi:hypothetical protein
MCVSIQSSWLCADQFQRQQFLALAKALVSRCIVVPDSNCRRLHAGQDHASPSINQKNFEEARRLVLTLVWQLNTAGRYAGAKKAGISDMQAERIQKARSTCGELSCTSGPAGCTGEPGQRGELCESSKNTGMPTKRPKKKAKKAAAVEAEKK